MRHDMKPSRSVRTPFLIMTVGALWAVGCGMNVPGAGGPTNVPIVYGNASAGARVVSGDENWNDPAQAPVNLQFIDLTINPGVTLTLPSGMTIRCTGAFVNNGNIVVRPGADGGFAGSAGPGGVPSAQVVDPLAGVGTLPAQGGDSGDNTAARGGGGGGFGISEFEARQLLVVAIAFGGGGGAGGTNAQSSGVVDNFGSSGGGAVRILAAGALTNAAAATMTADGAGGAGGGGGGGGIILASMTSVTNDGTILARGGSGEDGDSNEAPGGGGGGGIVHLLAPAVSSPGTVDVSGGAAGAVGPGVSAVMRFGGGGGGGSGGSGGAGGGVPAGANVAPTAAGAGGAGFFLVTPVDPTSLL